MTTLFLLACRAHRLPLRTSTALILALLLFGLAPVGVAADGAPMMPSVRPSTVEGTVSNVTGPILDLIEGGLQIDVTNATITGDVVAIVHNPPPGSLAPSYIVALSITKAPAITPPGLGDRATEFDGIVESIPAAPTVNDALLGHGKISSRDVLVNALTKLDSGIVVGSSVHVKGTFVASTNGSSLFATLFVATSITKN